MAYSPTDPNAPGPSNPYLPAPASSNPYLPVSTHPHLPAPASTNPYLPASTNHYAPTSTNPHGPASKQRSSEGIPRLKFPNSTGHWPPFPCGPVPTRKILDGLPRGNSREETGPKPFHQTHLGRLPPELREMIFTELLATPPTFGGHDFVTTSSNVRASPTAPSRFVHITASWRQVLWTCRQIYREAYPIFFASSAYFFAKPTTRIFDYLAIDSFRRVLRLDTITALCLSGFVETKPLYSKERLDDIFSDPNYPGRNLFTRQELEMKTFKTIRSSSAYSLQGLKSLRTVSLCMLVGEELLYINLLYELSEMRRGVVEFLDPSHWLIRDQNPEDAWSIQYACFTSGDFNKGRDNEEISYDRRCIELDVTDIDSRAPGLHEGDERFVEVSIGLPAKKSPAQEPLSSKQDDRSSTDTNDDSDVVSLNGGSHETQPGTTVPADISDEGDIEPLSRDSHEIQQEASPDQAEENVLTEDSGNDDVLAEVEPNSNVDDGSPILGLDSEESRDSQETMVTHQEGDRTLLQASSEEVSGVQSSAQRSLPAESNSLSRTLERLAPLGTMTTRDDQLSLLHTSDGHSQIQVETETNNSTAHVDSLHHTENSNSEHSAETDQVQQILNVSGTVPSSSRRQLLPPISDAPNPYTEEEMESYERWLQGPISRTQQQDPKALRTKVLPSPPHEKHIDGLVKTSLKGNTTDTPAKEKTKTSLQEISVLLPVASLLLLLVPAILAYLP